MIKKIVDFIKSEWKSCVDAYNLNGVSLYDICNPKISVVSKLDGIKSWSLQALKTCPGAFEKSGNIVDACKGCYARFGMANMPAPKKARIHNKSDWKNEYWVEKMVDIISKQRKGYFRWFDSGDVYSPGLAKKIFEVMEKTPNIKHWLPTRSHKNDKIKSILEDMKNLRNVVVRYSADSIDGTYTAGVHGSTIIDMNAENINPNITICHASMPDTDTKCNGCRKCWDKEVDVIGYVGHGRVMNKVQREVV